MNAAASNNAKGRGPSRRSSAASSRSIGSEPRWYKDAIVYELHVRSFADSDGDGIGDFRGLTEKVPYLADLGVTAIWLLPFYPSPLRDDGYDIADYMSVNPSYGTLGDVRQFIREAHRHGLRVITELVCNHTSDQHAWFQRARRAKKGSIARDFYVWSDTTEKYKDARIIFKDFERSNWTWDPVAQAYYWHRFFSHQPDLNFDNPAVWKAMFRVLDFWLELGIDGLRLDAVPYLFEREGTSCENLPETHEFLKALRRHVDEKFTDRMLLAEANQWPEDSVAYFGDDRGPECHMAFHFPVMPRLFMSIHMEDRFPVIDILTQTPPLPEGGQWALFLRNHDELTLEMVTDEERDYMYRVYAQDRQARINLGIRRRLAPLLGNHRRKIELMNGLLFSLPGTPVIYYGDELGMGDNFYLGDRNGVRTPMQWSADRNAGFSSANPQRLFLPIIIDPEYHYESINVATQQGNAHSLLWWMKRLIAMRRRYRAFGRGSLTFLQPENRKVLAFVRQLEDERLLIIANLSRYVQCAELDLSAYKGQVPVEVFGKVVFPSITDRPYFVTLGPHSFYWFSLEPQHTAAGPFSGPGAGADLPRLELAGPWTALLDQPDAIAAVLPGFLARARWYGGKGRGVKAVSVADVIPLPGAEARIALLSVEDSDGRLATYQLALAFAEGPEAAHLAQSCPGCIIAALRVVEDGSAREGVLYDALAEHRFGDAILDAIAGRRRLRSARGEVQIEVERALRSELAAAGAPLLPSVVGAEQSNTSLLFGSRFMLKLYRRLEPGLNPEVEIGRFLARHGFTHTPPILGSIDHVPGSGAPTTLGVLHGYVPNEGDAWHYTLDTLDKFLEGMITSATPASALQLAPADLLDLAGRPPPPEAQAVGAFLESARLLGERTAQLHLAFASDPDDPAFAPEPFTPFYQRSIYQSMRNLARQAFEDLRRARPDLPPEMQGPADEVLSLEEEVRRRLQRVYEVKIEAARIRHHGDYHLGQVLFTGKDFLIIDFEGEPKRPLSERAIKRSPLRDVAGMVRSLHYASCAALRGPGAGGVGPSSAELAVLRTWARCFYGWSSAVFLGAYLGVAGGAPFVPKQREQLEILLSAFLLEKALYEASYELSYRPAWLPIPLDGILQLLGRR